MNEIVKKKFLLAGVRFMPEMLLKQQKRGDTKYIHRNKLDKDMAYGDFKDLAKRTASDKALRDKAFNIAKNPKHHGYQRGLASRVYKFFGKTSTGSGIKQNEQLTEKLHKPPIIRKLKKEKYIHHLKTIFGVLILQTCN